MGIVNVTPDSFSDGGSFLDTERAVVHAERLISEGADIIDIGGESSRPGARPVSGEEEIRRVIPVIEKIRQRSPIPISIDTTKSEVARAAIEVGANMINDISAMTHDPCMIGLAADPDISFCLVHMQGNPQTMQKQPLYTHVVKEVKAYLRERIDAIHRAGIGLDRILIDPGIGFGKRLEDNIELIKNLKEFQQLHLPILLGTSRKSFIDALLGGCPPNDRLEGTLASIAATCQKGVLFYRVHDVKAAKRFITIYKALM